MIQSGPVATELATSLATEAQTQLAAARADISPLQPRDVADAILYSIAQPLNVSVSAVLIRPLDPRP